MRLSILRHGFSATLASLTFLFFMATVLNAQEKQYSANKADMALKSAARVDPATLGMSLDIPFGGAPGRAGTSLSSSIRYSSKQWRIKYIMGWQSPITYNVWTRPAFSENSMGGWTSSLDPPRIEFTGMNQPYDAQGNPLPDDPQAEYYEICYIPRINLHLPAGGSIEFRKSDTPQCFSPWEPNPDFSGTFYATDGTGMRFNNDTGVLHTSDGGRYLFGPNQSVQRGSEWQSGRWATQYIDRNGNVINYTFTNATDTLGRTYANALPNLPVVGDQNYAIAGFAGQNLNYTLRWRSLADVLSDPASGLRYTSNKKCLQPNNYQLVSPYLFVSSYPTHVCSSNDLFNPVVLSEVVLPNGRSYQFKYNAFGEIDKIIYPTGSYERFLYAEVRPLGDVSDPYDQANRGVVERWVSAKGDGTDETHWLYGVDLNSGYRVTMTAPNLTRTERLLHVGGSGGYFGFDNPLAGKAYEERSYNAANQMLRRRLTQWSTITPPGGQPRNPHVTKTVSLILDTTGNALATTAISQYDQDLNVTSVEKYDFASIDQGTAQTGAITSIASGALLRKEETTYLVNDVSIAAGIRQTYRDHNLIRLVSSSRIRNSADAIVAQAALVYDEASYMLPSYGSVTGWIDPQTNPRGLPTTTRSWLDTTNSWLEIHMHYDRCGNPRKTTDALGNVSEVQYSSAYHYAYPTQTISADPDGAGPVAPLTTNTVYDLTSGAVASIVDANNKTTNFEYAATDTIGNSNSMQNLTKVTRADGGWTAYGYNDAPGNLFVLTRSTLDGSRNMESTTYFDGLGRGWRHAQSEGATSIYAETQFDLMGRAWKFSNPYRNGETVLWTTTGYDALGRVISVTTPDNAVLSTAYSGNSVTVTDQANKKRKSVTDGLGRLVEVYEDPAGVNYLTTYKYDVLGNLRKVEQGTQVRFFMYDSLSRLIRAKNPEQDNFTPDSNFPAVTDSTSGTSNSQWSTANMFDVDGNVVKQKDPRNITTTRVYDALSRNTSVDYSDATPDTWLQYDLATNGKGLLNQAWQSGNTTSATYIDGYDAVGRPLVQRQKFETNGVWSGDYQVQRTYNLGGGVTSQTYPSGRTVNYSYDDAGRTLGFTGNLGDGVNRTYATGINYSVWGGLSRELFGTDIPLYHRQHYTNRGQLFDMRVGTTDDGAWNRGAIINYYSLTNWGFGNTGTDTNGNVYGQQHWIFHDDQMSASTVHQQNYAYDSLNRITWVGEYLNGGTHTGAQQYLYDRWGNRKIDPATWGTGINNKQFDVNTANNRLAVPGGQSGAMSYDGAGNMTSDTYTGAGSRTYDAENRMTSAQGGAQSSLQYYAYNSDGQRVRRKVEGVETWQIYGMDDELLAEYATGTAATSPQKEYGYRNGQLLVTTQPATGGGGNSTPIDVTWTNLSSTITANGSALQKLSGSNNWDAGAVSTQTISGDGYVEFTASQNITWRMCGLGNGDSSPSYTDIEYAIYADGSGNLTIYESGNNRGTVGTYTGTDKLKVAVEGGVVKYYRNATLLYTSTVAPQYPLLVDSSISTGSTGVNQFTNVVISGAAFNVTWTNLSSTITANGSTLQKLSGSNNWDAGAVSTQTISGDGYVEFTASQNITWRMCGLGNGDSSPSYTDIEYAIYADGSGNLTIYESGNNRGTVGTYTGTDKLKVAVEGGVVKYYRNATLLYTSTVAPQYPLLVDSSISTGSTGVNQFTNVVISGMNSSASVINWLVADHLGTPRMIFDKTGSLANVKRHDYLPFGEELFAGVGGRTTQNGYSGNAIRQKFTSYERDHETGLDFAQARYYANAMGRFKSIDPENAGADITEPQSWNGYSYVENNPLNFIDPDGLTGCSAEFSSCNGGDDEDAIYERDYGGMPRHVAAALHLHNQRIANSIGGYGFITNAEVRLILIRVLVRDPETGEMVPAGHADYIEDTPWHERGPLGTVGIWARGVADELTGGFVSWYERREGRISPAEEEWLANSDLHNNGRWVGFMGGLIVPGPGKVVKAKKIVDVSLRGTKKYAKELFRKQAGDQALKVMRDRGTNRIKGVRTVSGDVILRPKFGKGGVISNVEVIKNGTRLDVHVMP
jgi:RHS repeat-associated protein